jgi:hypothetical protein
MLHCIKPDSDISRWIEQVHCANRFRDHRPAVGRAAASLVLSFFILNAADAADPARPDALCVTEGTLAASGQDFTVSGPRLRAVSRSAAADFVEARFTYLGPSDTQLSLASGALRRQFGLKLRAVDACNLIYVMWRFAPDSRLAVQTKSNPEEHASRACGNRGYATVKAQRSAPLPALNAADTHVLRAQLQGRELVASVDGRVVWQGELAQLPAGAGPVGVRADNVRVRFQVSFQTLAGEPPLPCSAAPEDSD